MSLDVINDLISLYKNSVPGDLTSDQIGEDIAATLATILAEAEEEVSRLAAGVHLGTATGLFLDQHAKDRGLRRQDGETDDQLRERLRVPPRAGTVSAILDALEQIIGNAGDVFIIELPKDAFFFDRQSAFFDRGCRFGGGRGVVIALIPQSANARAAITDALRSTVSAGKIWFVEEYT